jgi:pyridoxal phosphate enzyme (YggS family)
VSGVAERLLDVRARIGAAARRCGRDPASVTLVGVAKRQPVDAVVEAVHAGLAHVGESYVQEAAAKLPAVEARLAARGLAPPVWHLVGLLQTNKAATAARLFAVVESVDRIELARALDRRAVRPLDALVQVNLSREPQKGGAPVEAVASLLTEMAPLGRLRVVGLMTVPAAGDDPEASRPAFAELRRLRDALRGKPGAERLHELSMGMSADFEVAVEEGATIVRVGEALFGPREGDA